MWTTDDALTVQRNERQSWFTIRRFYRIFASASAIAAAAAAAALLLQVYSGFMHVAPETRASKLVNESQMMRNLQYEFLPSCCSVTKLRALRLNCSMQF
jgi:cell division protein FtsX